MHIIWHGQAYFQIVATRQRGEQITISIDPYNKEVGLRPPSFTADIVLITHEHFDHNNRQANHGQPFIINGPGEYELRDIFIQGINSWHDNARGKERGKNTIYVIEAEDMRICHLGDLGQKELDSSQVEAIGNIDILLIPVGGVYTIDGQEAARIVSQIEPRIVIPMHYAIPNLKPKLEKVDKFLKAMGIRTPEILPKLLIKKKDLPQEETKVIILKP